MKYFRKKWINENSLCKLKIFYLECFKWNGTREIKSEEKYQIEIQQQNILKFQSIFSFEEKSHFSLKK